MQTFLPDPDFRKSAAYLDSKRLGNQCYREGKTLATGGWSNHPASKMWRNYEYALCTYALALLDEMEKRGEWKKEVVPRWRKFFTELRATYPDNGMPPWLGNEDFHASHRSNLLRKDPEYYSQFGWTEPHDLEYIWP